jgi:hypothetical protein
MRLRIFMLLALLVAIGGCSRVDTLRFAHGNAGTPVEWPGGEAVIVLELERTADGRPWVPVSVDGNAPVPFLLQASAGAIALTGARAAGFGPAGAGTIRLSRDLLPGIGGGRLIKQRRLELGELVLGDQSLLLVEQAEWPHGQPGGGAAGVFGFDLLRRFRVELDFAGQRVLLYRRGAGVPGADDVRRLAVVDRLPYFETWMEYGPGTGRWIRLQFEPAADVGICLDDDPRPGRVVLAGRTVRVTPGGCQGAAGRPGRSGLSDGVLGIRALEGLVVSIDYERRELGFRAAD